MLGGMEASNTEHLGDDIIAEMDHPAGGFHQQSLNNFLNPLGDISFNRSSTDTISAESLVLTEETSGLLITGSQQSRIGSGEEMFNSRKNARDNPASTILTGPSPSQGVASGVPPVNQIFPPRAAQDPPSFTLISLEEAQRRQSSHVRQHSSTPDLRGSYSMSDGEIPPIPRLLGNDFSVHRTSQIADRPSPLRKSSEAASSLVPRSGLEDSVELTPSKGDYYRGRSAARAVASIAGGLKQMNPFRRGVSRSNRSNRSSNLESTPQKGGSEEILLPSGDNFQTPSKARRSGKKAVLTVAEVAVLPSLSISPQTLSGNSESVVMTNPASLPYGFTTPGATPETENRRFETRQQPQTTLHLNSPTVDCDSPKFNQDNQQAMPQPSSGRGGSTHTTNPPSVLYDSNMPKDTPMTAERLVTGHALELHQTAPRSALQGGVSSGLGHPSRHASLSAPDDLLKSPLTGYPSIAPIDYPVSTDICLSGDSSRLETAQPRYRVAYSPPPRGGSITAATFPSGAASKTQMSPIRRYIEGHETSHSWVLLKENSCGDDASLLSGEQMKGVGIVQKTDGGELGENSPGLKYVQSFAVRQDVTNEWETDVKTDVLLSKNDTMQTPGSDSLANLPIPAKGSHDSGDPRSPVSNQLLMARMSETQSTSVGQNRDTRSRPTSTAPNHFPPSSRKPLPSIPVESQNANPSTPQKVNIPAREVSATPSQSGSEGQESPNFSRPRPLESRLGSLKSPNFNPSPYGTLPRPLHTSVRGASSSNDPFIMSVSSEDENVEGVVINTKPNMKLFADTKNSRGPSFEKVIAVTEKLRRGQYDNGGTKLARVKKLTVKDLWNGVGFSNIDAECGVKQASESQRREEGQAVELIAAVLKMMNRLQEFEWKSELPFTKVLWSAMSTATITSVFIDIFKAGIAEDNENDVFLPEDLVPLRTLNALKSLTLVGMTESYQKQIWEALWLIPSMKHLDLRMTTEPVLRRDRDEKWGFIKGSWKIRRLNEGNGKIHFNNGYGEYLDIMCMMKAWRTTHPDQPQRKMGLESLTLEGFIVDAQPFVKIFEEAKLKKLEFVGLNMDAGLALKPSMMTGMKVIAPDEGKQPQVRQMATFYPAGSAKLITIGRG